MGVAELSAVLWRERHLLELLLFKLEQERLVLASGRSRWLGHATREIEQAMDRIRTAELGRSIESDAAARDFGVEPGSSLLALAEAAPAPWDELLASHRQAFVCLMTQIQEVTHDNHQLLVDTHRATRQSIVDLQRTVETNGFHTASSGPVAALVV